MLKRMDVTAVLDSYRECVRHLWNTYFWREAEARNDWDLSDEFETVAKRLFRVLVLKPLQGADAESVREGSATQEPWTFLRVEVEQRSPIMINRGVNTGYWDDPLVIVSHGELDLHFVDFFDWTSLGFRDFGLYRVRIAGSKAHPSLLGRDALVPVGPGVKVFHEETVPAEEG